MYLENLVVDAVDPQGLGHFWEAALGCERLTDEPGLYETRLVVEGGPALDLCFQQVADPPPDPRRAAPRLHPDLAGGDRQGEVVERLLGLGGRHLDLGQHDVPWVVLADPEGNPFCVTGEPTAYAGTGPLVSLPQDSADPARDAAFWSWLAGWQEVDPGSGAGARALRHPSGRGPVLLLCPEPAPKGTTKNRWHLDVRLEAADDPDEVAAGIAERGGREYDAGWGELPWRTFTDPSGNEVCVLAARGQAG